MELEDILMNELLAEFRAHHRNRRRRRRIFRTLKEVS